jgi:hypothetical protein
LGAFPLLPPSLLADGSVIQQTRSQFEVQSFDLFRSSVIPGFATVSDFPIFGGLATASNVPVIISLATVSNPSAFHRLSTASDFPTIFGLSSAFDLSIVTGLLAAPFFLRPRSYDQWASL